MSAATRHFKLGLFALLGLGGALAAAFGLGLQATTSDARVFHTYFDESVQGLEIGSPVKYRGVPVGTVASIAVAPDRRHVDVASALDETAVASLGLDTDRGVPPDLRAQLGSQGITGVKFVSLDLIRGAPLPDLPFRTPPDHIPAAPSLMKNLESGVSAVMDDLPAVTASAIGALREMESLVAEVREEQVPMRLTRSLDELDGAVADLRATVNHFDQAQLPARTASVLDNLNESIVRVNRVLARVDGDEGLVSSARRATDAMGDLGRTANGSAADLERTLRDVSEAAQAIRDLAESLERDPDMLLKGRSRQGNP